MLFRDFFMTDITESSLEDLLETLDENIGDLLICRCCLAPITQCDQRIEVGLSHYYRFTNPAGIIYAIGCYRYAPGCNITGLPTLEDTWFGGYRWQAATCSDCQEHLGWYYQNNRDRFFYGLIQARLIKAAE